MKNKTKLLILSMVLFTIGMYLLISVDLKIGLGVFLLQWSANLEAKVKE